MILISEFWRTCAALCCQQQKHLHLSHVQCLWEKNTYRFVFAVSVSRTCGTNIRGVTPLWPLQPSVLSSLRQPLSLPTRLLTHSTCQKQDRCPWYPKSGPTPTSQQHFTASPCHPDQTPWPPPSSSSCTATGWDAPLSLSGDICYVMTVGRSERSMQVEFTGCRLVNMRRVLQRVGRTLTIQKGHVGKRKRHFEKLFTCSLCSQTHTHPTYTQEAEVHPLTGWWPDSPAAASCLMFYSEDQISFPDFAANRKKTARGRKAHLPPFTLEHRSPGSTVDPPCTVNNSVNVFHINFLMRVLWRCRLANTHSHTRQQAHTQSDAAECTDWEASSECPNAFTH